MPERFQARPIPARQRRAVIEAMASYEWPQGGDRFTRALARPAQQELGWDLTPRQHRPDQRQPRTPSSVCSACWPARFADGRQKEGAVPLAPSTSAMPARPLLGRSFRRLPPPSEAARRPVQIPRGFRGLRVGDDVEGHRDVPADQSPPAATLTEQGRSNASDRIARDRIPLLSTMRHHVRALPRGIVFGDAKPFGTPARHPPRETSPGSAAAGTGTTSSSPTRRSSRPSPAWAASSSGAGSAWVGHRHSDRSRRNITHPGQNGWYGLQLSPAHFRGPAAARRLFPDRAATSTGGGCLFLSGSGSKNLPIHRREL